MQKGISQIRRMLNLIWSDSCLDLFAALLRVRAYPVVRGLWAPSLGTEGRVIAKRGGESGEWREGARPRGRAADNKLTG